MNEDNVKITKSQLARESARLIGCPFCGGKAVFLMDKSEHLIIEHLPDAGVCCPARYSQVCDTFDMGLIWWNKREI